MYTKQMRWLFLVGIGLLVAFRQPGMLPSNFLTSLTEKVDQYNEKLPLEKIYLHTDKPFYKPGEDIWFKAYAVNGTDHTAQPVSHVLYVELINPRGNVEKSLTLFLKDGGTYGDFHLDESVPGGLYRIRAYTQWMKNFGEAAFFEKELMVQKVLTPRLLMKLDFERKAYSAGEPVTAELELKNLQDIPLTGQSVKFTVQLAGSLYQQGTAVTGADGKAKLQFTLPATLHTTDGLLNIITDHEGTAESISRSVPIVLHKIALQFFPEGGDLVAGVPGRVAFKALNEFGKPADVAGYVTDQSGKRLQRFQSFHQGMGVFWLTAAPGRQYRVHLTQPAITETYPLPTVLPKGYALTVDSVYRNQIQLSFHAPTARTVYLVGQVRGKIYFTQEIAATTGRNIHTIPTRNFPIGVAQLTLFDYNQVPRCERLVFVNAHKKLHVSVTPDKATYMPREKVALTIRTTDEDSLPIPARLSVAVADDRLLSFADDKQDNLLSYLLVSSDLKGKIEEPSFYFKSGNPKAARALDYVMLTHGWRRFTWQQIAEGPPNSSFLPEKTGSISGVVRHRQTNQPLAATVTLFELNDKRRSAQLKTGPDGAFVFQKVNPKVPVQIFAQAAGTRPVQVMIELDNQPAGTDPSEVASENDGFAWQNEALKEKVVVTGQARRKADQPNKMVPDQKPKPEEVSMNDLKMTEDVKALSEVVVVGYSTQRKRDLTGAIATVSQRELGVMPRTSLEQTLQGRVAGVQVQQTNGAPGGATNIRIRGTGSVVNSNPLYVIDGTPVMTVPFLTVDEIESIEVIKSGQAAALYGSRGANGVVVITTKKRRYFHQYVPDNRQPLGQLYVPERKFSVVRAFYAPVYESKEPVAQRDDFRSTIYWNPNVQTDARTGTAQVSFYNSDQVTTFRITTEGIGTAGLVGHHEQTYTTQLPFSIEAKIPPYLTFGDVADIPVSLKNNTGQALHGTLTIQAPPHLKITTFDGTVNSIPGEAKTLYLRAEVQHLAGKGTLQLVFGGNGFQETINQEIEVQPKGFPTEMAFAGRQKDASFSFQITDPVPGSLKAALKAYPDVVSNLMDGIESVLREPHGCFEQTSSATYPNVLALQYLRETGKASDQTEIRALQYIAQGYKRLTGFETKEGGFEWFGGTPPHEALTAFGIAEFTEMKKVYKGVDETMLNRTKQWILSRRDGNGGFKQDSRRMHYISGSTEAITAYIVYALSEAGMKEIRREYEAAYQQALGSQDIYQKALLANAAFNFGEVIKGDKLIAQCLHQIHEKGLANAKMTTSMTGSYGQSLRIETVALLLQALLKTGTPDPESVQQMLTVIVNARSYGGFGSTQATILALKALTEYARFARRTAEGGNLLVYLGKELIGSKAYEKDIQGAIILDGLERYLQTGMQPMRVVFENTGEALPYALNVSWSSHTPRSAPECKVDIETRLSAPVTRTGQTIRLTTLLTNKTSTVLPMTVALVGIPSGLSPQPWQLKELQEKKVVDFYEVRKNYIVFYYRGVAPNARHQIHLDLKAEIPGTYQAPASTAYLYYTQEFKDWESGEKAEIRK